MSLKAELETWAAALAAYDAENFEESLELFTVCNAIFLEFCGQLINLYSASLTLPKSSLILD